MSNYETLHLSFEKYLKSNGWSIDTSYSTSIVSLWVNTLLNESIRLPTKEGLKHQRAEKTIDEALDDLADIIDLPASDVKELLLNLSTPPVDHIHIRAAGEAIEHGRINFRTNHQIETAIYSIIKTAANSFILKTKKQSKKNKTPSKAEYIEAYLSSVNTVIPAGGSFIYNLDIDLKKVDGFEEAESLQRYVNTKLASALNELYTIEVDNVTTASLIQKGLNESICSNFIGLFSNDIETIECTFDWSDSEPAPKLKSNKLVFTRSHKEKVRKLKEKFNSTKSLPLKNANAHLSRLVLKPEHAEIRLRVVIEGAERTCDAEINLETAQQLMRALGEKIEQPVMIDGTAWIEKTASKQHYSLSIDSICSEKGQNLSLLDA
ncbi:hypothetical protein P3626_10580 [Vibrio parahaemolyticus]|uniref:hypothetical protein n=1 Tax=Vibrio TaxID=662 RepID=UPI001BD1E359|nr:MULTISPECIES: hypothetical protein [Vibrio]MDF5324078.1 hypothetical protein [Vibrio parahaemolyticus]EGQ8056436.1 hypothetical protein [Vibrio alginolyticus]EIF2704041.1 hypothetical protein [Vibrio alginolyticus]ELA7569199.1 hypothetical protein [Vibrio alginolyticus]ELB1089335.1 hypothetical protein [Vibrio alginolyticus]